MAKPDPNEATHDPLIAAILANEPTAWPALIDRFEGRLIAFTRARVADEQVAEDIVQETFLGFLRGLQNYDPTVTPVESYLFAICRYKITDELRRRGRIPAAQVRNPEDAGQPWADLPGGRWASSIARSQERNARDEQSLRDGMMLVIAQLKRQEDWPKLKCLELLLLSGLPNRTVATKLGMTEQQVANHKVDFSRRLKKAIAARTRTET